MTDQLTPDNFQEKHGHRFRVNNEQQARIAAGTLTREQAFEEFLAKGGVEKLKPRKPEIPDSVYLSDGLTLENFSERVKEATGVARRFRMSRAQSALATESKLTREQALAEVIASVKAKTIQP